MRKLLVACALLVMLTLAACGGGGGSGTGGSTVSMGTSAFSGATRITIKVGDSVTFDDAAGGPHDLVIGTSGKFVAASGAPSALNSSDGVDFKGGDKKTVVFPTTGTFSITRTLHPSLQATVTVTP